MLRLFVLKVKAEPEDFKLERQTIEIRKVKKEGEQMTPQNVECLQSKSTPLSVMR